jgi:hypothetical protein
MGNAFPWPLKDCKSNIPHANPLRRKEMNPIEYTPILGSSPRLLPIIIDFTNTQVIILNQTAFRDLDEQTLKWSSLKPYNLIPVFEDIGRSHPIHPSVLKISME